MQIITLIISVSKAFSIVNEWIHLFIAEYAKHQISTMKKENRDAIKKAIDEQDQRDLEKAMGSTKVGEVSGIPGTEIIDTLPGVK